MTRRNFEFVAGTIALSLVDTVAARGRDDTELLASPADLDEWIEHSEFRGLHVPSSESELDQVRRLRDAIFRACSARIDGEVPSSSDIDLLNAAASAPDFRPKLVNGCLEFVAEKTFTALCSALAADALRILTDVAQHRLRRCSECAMLFYDNSFPGRRQWCSSSSGCGNRAKVRRHRQRIKDSKNGKLTDE